ncbi:DMT family transporter [Anaerocolumna sp. MB42-C2]|uniref:DMT family transporter n=1 Tax=Anaerocolumna sp. MB42-C2 TaxID=3070997 RepID=UPI0027DED8EB|nr:DMT family transporter [Anaerocolumna sp. MB42-C2]WMJ87528.1 DMT family transporter [Anaerocolumna sp. MB42-C2]
MALLYYFLSLVSGMALTLQAGLNGQLRSKVGSPVCSSFISFLVGAIGLGLVLSYTLLSGTYSLSDGTNMLKGIRWWMLTGGLLGAFYIFITILASPKIGFANMFSLVICGQIVLSIMFDHFGFFGNDVHLINPQRIFGVVLLIAGVYVIQKF